MGILRHINKNRTMNPRIPMVLIDSISNLRPPVILEYFENVDNELQTKGETSPEQNYFDQEHGDVMIIGPLVAVISFNYEWYGFPGKYRHET
jgi:hypothetical protein